MSVGEPGDGRAALSRAAGLFLVLALAVTGPGLLPGRVLAPLDLPRDAGAWKPDPSSRVEVSNRLLSDVALQFHPWQLESRRLLARGEGPWRSARAGAGAPLWANPQTALLSPLTWLRLAWPERGWAAALALQLWLAGLGMFLWTRALGASDRGAAVAGGVFELSGAMVLYAPYPIAGVVAAIPLLGWTSARALAAPSATRLLAVTATAALATAGGHPESLLLGVGAVGAVLALRFGGEVRPRAAAAVAGAALAGFLLLGAVLVPFGHLVAGSHAAATRAAAAVGPFRWTAVAGTLLPGFLGSPLAGELDLSGAIAHGGHLIVRSASFLGVLPLVALAVALRGASRRERLLLALAATALLVSWQTPLVAHAVHRLPLLSLLALEHAAVAFVLLACAALPAAWDRLAAGTGTRGLGIVLLVAGALLALAGAAPSLPGSRPALERSARQGIESLRARGYLRHAPEVYEARLAGYLERGAATAARRLALPGLCWCAAGIALVARRRRPDLLAGVALAELLALGVGWLPAVERSAVAPAPPFVADLARLDPDGLAVVAAAEEIYPANLGTVDGVRQVDSYDVLESAARMRQLAAAGYSTDRHGFPARLAPEQTVALAALDVDYFLSREPSPGLERVGGGAPPVVGLYRLPGAAPSPPPANAPPAGLATGLVVSGLGALLAAALAFAARCSRARRSGE